MSKLKKALDELNRASLELIQAQERNHTLREKSLQLSAHVENLAVQIQQVESDKRKALDVFVLDESKDHALKQAKAKYKTLKDEIDQIGELIEAYERVRMEYERSIPVLQGAVKTAWIDVIRVVFESVAEQVQPEIRGAVLDAYASLRIAEGGNQFGDFPTEPFDSLRMDLH